MAKWRCQQCLCHSFIGVVLNKHFTQNLAHSECETDTTYYDYAYHTSSSETLFLWERVSTSESSLYSRGLLGAWHTRWSIYACGMNGTQSWARRGFCLQSSQSHGGAGCALAAFSAEHRNKRCIASLFCRPAGQLPATSQKGDKKGRPRSRIIQQRSILSNQSSDLRGWIKWPIQRASGLWQRYF